MLVGFYWLGDSITLAMYLSGCDIPINFLNMELKTFPAMIAFLLAIKGISAGIIVLVSMVMSKRYHLWITSYSILFAFSGYGIALTFFNIALILGIYQEPDPEIISSMLYIIPGGVVVNTAMLLKHGLFKKKFFLVLAVLLLANAASGDVYSHDPLQKLFLNTSELESVEAGKSGSLKILVENRGDPVEYVKLRISSDYFILSKKEYFFPVLYSNITPVLLDIYAPFSFRDNADLDLHIEGWNKSGFYYINNLTKKIRVRSIEFSKSALPKEVVLNSNRPNITIFLYLKNPTGENAYAYVEDVSLNTTKEWFVNIGKGESKTLKCEIKPAQVGNITLPPAKAFVSAAGL
ncbi:MAG: hypothetical protein KJ714_07520, partial [Euryarchaeota archaeon]|nr:hypothetical protein [Euryarchaeota archaeon]